MFSFLKRTVTRQQVIISHNTWKCPDIWQASDYNYMQKIAQVMCHTALGLVCWWWIGTGDVSYSSCVSVLLGKLALICANSFCSTAKHAHFSTLQCWIWPVSVLNMHNNTLWLIWHTSFTQTAHQFFFVHRYHFFLNMYSHRTTSLVHWPTNQIFVTCSTKVKDCLTLPLKIHTACKLPTDIKKNPVVIMLLLFQITKSLWIQVDLTLNQRGYSQTDLIPYSEKLSREKTFANFAVLWLFTKVFRAKFGGAPSFGAAKVSNQQKFSPWKSYFSLIRESFLTWKFPAMYMVF